MTFALSEEQQMLKDSVDRFVAQDYGFDVRRALAESDLGYSAGNWKTFAELGWLSVPFAEENGGFGGGLRDVATMTEALGRGLVAEPFVPCLVLAGRLMEMLGSAEQRQGILPSVIAGETQLALAHTERRAASNPACVGCTVQADGDGFLISGEKHLVLNGPSADLLLVSARSGGAERDRQGVELFVVDAHADGIYRRDYPTIDGLRAADITFDKVRVTASSRLGDPGTNVDAIEAVIDEAIIACCAEAVGVMEVLVRDTVEYARTRKQFGTPIGKFQALQHRMVDMFVAQEQSRALLLQVIGEFQSGGAAARKAASAIKVHVSRSARLIGEQAIQIHGGMGTTDELHIGHYVKRLLALEALFGDTDYHLDRYAALID